MSYLSLNFFLSEYISHLLSRPYPFHFIPLFPLQLFIYCYFNFSPFASRFRCRFDNNVKVLKSVFKIAQQIFILFWFLIIWLKIVQPQLLPLDPMFLPLWKETDVLFPTFDFQHEGYLLYLQFIKLVYERGQKRIEPYAFHRNK